MVLVDKSSQAWFKSSSVVFWVWADCTVLSMYQEKSLCHLALLAGCLSLFLLSSLQCATEAPVARLSCLSALVLWKLLSQQHVQQLQGQKSLPSSPRSLSSHNHLLSEEHNTQMNKIHIEHHDMKETVRYKYIFPNFFPFFLLSQRFF